MVVFWSVSVATTTGRTRSENIKRDKRDAMGHDRFYVSCLLAPPAPVPRVPPAVESWVVPLLNWRWKYYGSVFGILKAFVAPPGPGTVRWMCDLCLGRCVVMEWLLAWSRRRFDPHLLFDDRAGSNFYSTGYTSLWLSVTIIEQSSVQ